MATVSNPGTGRDKWIKEQLTLQNKKDTPANRKKLGAEYDQIYVGGNRKDWRTFFKMSFPQLADMLDGADGERQAREVFGDLIDLFIDVATNPDQYDFDTQAGLDAFDRKVQGTQYAIRTTDKQAQWDALDSAEKNRQIESTKRAIATAFASSQLTNKELGDLSVLRLRNGLTDLELKYLVFDRLATRPGDGTIMQTTEAMDLVKTLRAYNYPFLEQDISNALTGATVGDVPQSSELLIAKAKNAAKTRYGQFADLIDQGFTVDDIFDPYRQLAAKTLGKSVNDIRLDNADYEKVLRANPATGETWTGFDWVKELKTDEKYGWQFTPEANQQASSIVSTIERAFGFRR
jgi:hypothetical protein